MPTTLEIKKNFQTKILVEIERAFGFMALCLIGKQTHESLTRSYPNAPFVFVAGEADSPIRTNKYAPTHATIQDQVARHPEILLEGFHAFIVQH